MMAPERCWWCDRSRPKAAGLCALHRGIFATNPAAREHVEAEIRAAKYAEISAVNPDLARIIERIERGETFYCCLWPLPSGRYTKNFCFQEFRTWFAYRLHRLIEHRTLST